MPQSQTKPLSYLHMLPDPEPRKPTLYFNSPLVGKLYLSGPLRGLILNLHIILVFLLDCFKNILSRFDRYFEQKDLKI